MRFTACLDITFYIIFKILSSGVYIQFDEMKACFLSHLLIHQIFLKPQLCDSSALSRDTAIKQLVTVPASRSYLFSKGNRQVTNM